MLKLFKKATKKTLSKQAAFSKRIIPMIIVAIMLYTIVAFILHFVVQVEISPTLTTCYFGFWTVEIVSLMTIKVSKVKNKYEENTEFEKDFENHID